MNNWLHCKNILCIRPDNMGDLIMSGPAMRALKQSLGCKITVLTSSMAAGVAKFMPEIDDVIVFDLPWIKTNDASNHIPEIVELIKTKDFDAGVIFTVYSQSSLPSALLAYQAGIPNVLAYCRENPYGLINYWVPDKEPYEVIKHQVKRDLDLVAHVGANVTNDNLQVKVNEQLWTDVIVDKLKAKGIDESRPWLVLHAGVSEQKRAYPFEQWVSVAKQLVSRGYQILFTGSGGEKSLTDNLQLSTGASSYSVGGEFKLDEFICLLKNTPAVISVNTGTVHIAAAVNTPVVVLYAQTNPQHTPWKVANEVLQYSIAEEMRSKNEIIAWVNKSIYNQPVPCPSAAEVVVAVIQLLEKCTSSFNNV